MLHDPLEDLEQSAVLGVSMAALGTRAASCWQQADKGRLAEAHCGSNPRLICLTAGHVSSSHDEQGTERGHAIRTGGNDSREGGKGGGLQSGASSGALQGSRHCSAPISWVATTQVHDATSHSGTFRASCRARHRGCCVEYLLRGGSASLGHFAGSVLHMYQGLPLVPLMAPWQVPP